MIPKAHTLFPALIVTMFILQSCQASNAVSPPLAQPGGTKHAPEAPALDPQSQCPALDSFPPGAQGPYYHQVRLARSQDGQTFVTDENVALDHASVPDGIQRPDGQVWVYYVNGEPGRHGIFISRLTSTGTLEEIGCVTLDGRFEGNAVDPDIVLLEDGRYRLFFFAGQFVGPPGIQGGITSMNYAVSDDGLDFVYEGQAIDVPQATDPTVVRLPDGSWLMAVAAGNTIKLATSADGVRFTLTGVEITPGGIPELSLLLDGRVRLYFNDPEGIVSQVSSDGGQSWQPEPGARLSVTDRLAADPSVVHMQDGSWLMFWKTMMEGAPSPAP